jgi:CRISPR/Cas system CSM-associated protein Csm3 (group 7 of RAMP superfamily)
MFRRWLNRATLRIAISPRGPILIKSGHETADPTRPGMEFVRSRHAQHGDTVYLPGTSLKGAMRSQAERVLRGLGLAVCDPFDRYSACRRGPRRAQGSPGSRGRRPPPPSSAQIFAEQCPACRTFGSLQMAGRCNVEDAYPWDREPGGDSAAANTTETRWQVGIDRRTGQAQGAALFDLEVVVAGTFRTTIHLDNFALWQLGLLGALLSDMDQGDVPIGFGKSRGLGQVAVQVTGIEVEALHRGGAGLLGAGALSTPAEAREYGLTGNDAMELPGRIVPANTWRGRRISASNEEAQALLDLVMAGPLKTWVDARGATDNGGRR